MANQRVRVLGIDPGSQRTGFGVLDVVGPRLSYVSSGVIRTTGLEIAIERVFMNRNADSALKLGQARGAAICGTADSQAQVFEYAPREIKLAVVGSGNAEKGQVQLMMRSLLKLESAVAADAADALAAAVCHALRARVRASMLRAAGHG